MILVDSNIILDIVTQDPTWYSWSADQLNLWTHESLLIINPIIYTEISIGFKTIEACDTVVSAHFFKREEIPYEACFLAGKIFVDYRKNKGSKQSPLPDFFIGAHAAVKGYSLLTRDITRYQTYFPTVTLISPFT